MAAARQLLAQGFHVGAIRPPTVPAGTCRLRVSLSAAHAMRDVDELADALLRCQVAAGVRYGGLDHLLRAAPWTAAWMEMQARLDGQEEGGEGAVVVASGVGARARM